ncbi:MAG: hypothetical protein JOZ93_14205, partial [Sinobacteraceae bacterium]|nr:hypothetical protein [Nevskiaceae bacterium]
FAAFQYFRDQHRASRLRLEEQFSQHLGTLTDYSQTGNLSSANVVWALTNLAELTKLSPTPAAYESRVTDVITTGMIDDADFANAQDVRADSICLARWGDYRRWLVEHPQEAAFLLYRYQQSFRKLAAANEKYFREMDYGPKGFVVAEFAEEQAYLLFVALVKGYEQHLALSPTREQRVAIDAFGDAIRNHGLATKVFSANTTREG